MPKFLVESSDRKEAPRIVEASSHEEAFRIVTQAEIVTYTIFGFERGEAEGALQVFSAKRAFTPNT